MSDGASLNNTIDSKSKVHYTVSELIPQAGAMILLDNVVEIGDIHIITELSVRNDGLFSDAHGFVPAWVGIEYMAQTVAAYSGYQRKRRGLMIELGFLLGTRHYQCSVGAFACGMHLTVYAEKVLEGSNGMSVFDCRIEGNDISATSNLNVFLPQDSKSFLTGKINE